MTESKIQKRDKYRIWLGSVTTSSSGSAGYYQTTVNYADAGFTSYPSVFLQVDYETYAQNGAAIAFGVGKTSCTIRTLSPSLNVRVMAIGE